MQRLAPLLVCLALVAGACGSDGPPTSSVCSSPTVEPLDPSSGLHVLRPDEVTFDDLTPTSGPHLPAGGPLGVQDTLPGAQQVAVLERGSVLVSVDAADPALLDAVRQFEELAVIHTIEGLDSPVVATAWQTRITCSEVDASYLAWFIANKTSETAAQPHG